MNRLLQRFAIPRLLSQFLLLGRAAAPASIKIRRSVLHEIESTVGSAPAESGGMLGGDRKRGLVTTFHFDASAHRSGATYSPDHEMLNRLLPKWNRAGIDLIGFVHSHPSGCRAPSGGDLIYAQRILEHNPQMPGLFMPIVMTKPDTGSFEFLPFVARRVGSGVRVDEPTLEILEDSAPARVVPALPAMAQRDVFARVEGAYNLRLLRDCRLVVVGVGGASAFVEDMARAGVGQFVLIDPDRFAASNLATQAAYAHDVGRHKVTCIAERIRAINPEAVVVVRPVYLDALNDPTMRSLLLQPVAGAPRPVRTLLFGFTDRFGPQARVNRLSLQSGVPSICAQLYAEGRGAEVTFTFPGVTPACHRCALSSRYAAYLEQGFTNNVTSHSTPIFATTRLNALKGFIAMALLHHGDDHPRWGSLLRRIGNRNLVQVRLDPDFGGAFERALAGADQDRVLFDDTVWLPQLADSPATGYPTCPDCGGTGDLRTAIGTFADTRIMRLRADDVAVRHR